MQIGFHRAVSILGLRGLLLPLHGILNSSQSYVEVLHCGTARKARRVDATLA